MRGVVRTYILTNKQTNVHTDFYDIIQAHIDYMQLLINIFTIRAPHQKRKKDMYFLFIIFILVISYIRYSIEIILNRHGTS